MPDEIREGDRFLVEVEVEVALPNMCKVRFGKGEQCHLWTDVLHASKRLPRSIKVGERVKDENGWLGVVVAMNTERAWVDWVEGGAGIRRLSNLTLATGETP